MQWDWMFCMEKKNQAKKRGSDDNLLSSQWKCWKLFINVMCEYELYFHSWHSFEYENFAHLKRKKMNDLLQLFPSIFILLRRHFIGIMTPCQLFSNNRTYLFIQRELPSIFRNQQPWEQLYVSNLWFLRVKSVIVHILSDRMSFVDILMRPQNAFRPKRDLK